MIAFVKKPIKELCTVRREHIVPRADLEYTLYSLPAFDNSQKPELIDGKDIKSSKLVVKPNTILFNKLNVRFRRVWNIHEMNDENAVCSTEFIPLTANQNILQDYLYYNLISDALTNTMDAARKGTSCSQQRIDVDALFGYEIDVPPITYQEKIVGILLGIDEKIKQNEAINHNLQQQAQAIFQSWFVDFSHWRNTPPDWEQGVFSDYVTVKRGGSPRPIQDYLSATGYRWLKISDVTSLQTPYITTIAEHIKESGIGKTVFLKRGSLVLSNSATPGIPKILDVDSCIHDGWLYFPQSEFSNEFLLLFFLQIRPKLVALGNGSVFTNLKTDILKSYPISKPPKEVLEEFDNIVKPLFSTILLNTRQNNHLICVRDSLLPKLMSGEIDVSEVEV